MNTWGKSTIDLAISFAFSMSSASSSTDVGSLVTSSSSFLSSLIGVGSSVTPGLIGALAKLMHNIVLLAPERIIAALNKAEILNSVVE